MRADPRRQTRGGSLPPVLEALEREREGVWPPSPPSPHAPLGW